MEIRQLRAFVTLANTLNFNEAAQKLFITQPALSKQIKSLENDLETLLFVRDKHSVQLTVIGKELYEQARILLLRLDQFRMHARSLSQDISGKLFLGFGLASLKIVPTYIAKFKLIYHDIAINLQDMSSKEQIENLLEDKLQIGFVRTPIELPLLAHVLLSDSLILAVNHKYKDEQGELKWMHYLRELPLLRLSDTIGHGITRQTEKFLAFHSIYPTITQYAGDIQTLLALVAADVGIAIVPKSVVNIAPKEVSIVQLDGQYVSWDIGVAWNPQYENSLRDAFIKLVIEWHGK